MATKISVEAVLPEHQDILESSAVIAQTVLNYSSRVKKGNDSINLPTLASKSGQDVAVGASFTNNNNTYGDDKLDLDRVGGDAWSVSLHDEEDNILDNVSDGLKAAIRSMSVKLDSNLYTKMLAAATASGFVRTADFYNDIVDMAEVMDTAQVPYSERFLLVTPSDYADLLKTKDFVRFDARGKDMIGKGQVGEILGFTVVRAQDSAITETIAYHRTGACLAWHSDAKILKDTDARAMTDQYSASRKFGTKALQAGAKIFKFSL